MPCWGPGTQGAERAGRQAAKRRLWRDDASDAMLHPPGDLTRLDCGPAPVCLLLEPISISTVLTGPTGNRPQASSCRPRPALGQLESLTSSCRLPARRLVFL